MAHTRPGSVERRGGAPASPLSAPRKAARWEEKKADPFPGAPEARKGGPLSIILCSSLTPGAMERAGTG